MLEPNINLLPEDLQSHERFNSGAGDTRRVSAEAGAVKEATEETDEYKRKTKRKSNTETKQTSVFRRFANRVMRAARPKKNERAPVPQKFGAELLTQDVLGPRSARREIARLLGIACGFVFLFAIVYAYYEWRVQKIQTVTLAIKEESVQLDVAIARARSDLERTKQTTEIVATIDAILAHRTDWNAILKRLESLTVSTVYYTAFTSGGEGTIELTARAKTLDDALLQIHVLKNADDFISSVEADQFSVTEEKITVAGVEDNEGVTTSFVEFPLFVTLADDWIYGKTENN